MWFWRTNFAIYSVFMFSNFYWKTLEQLYDLSGRGWNYGICIRYCYWVDCFIDPGSKTAPGIQSIQADSLVNPIFSWYSLTVGNGGCYQWKLLLFLIFVYFFATFKMLRAFEFIRSSSQACLMVSLTLAPNYFLLLPCCYLVQSLTFSNRTTMFCGCRCFGQIRSSQSSRSDVFFETFSLSQFLQIFQTTDFRCFLDAVIKLQLSALSRCDEHLNPPLISWSDCGNELFYVVGSALRLFEEDSLLGQTFLAPQY